MSSHSYNQDEETDNDKGFRNILIGVAVIAAALIICAILTGCSPTKRMAGIASKHPISSYPVL